MDFRQRSIDIILENQHASGAYIASPNFPTYHYCWFRDGSYIAYAMDLVGQSASAKRFHAWAARAVNQRSSVVQRALRLVADGKPIGETEILHTRYTLDGQDGTHEEWPNFQLDGFGTWLWALNQHRILSGSALPADWLQAASLTAGYLEALWRQPCFDCWEEFPSKVHLLTLAAIYGGLQACKELDGKDRSKTLAEIKGFIFEKGLVNGHFAKFIGADTVDASLLGLSTPYRVVTPDDPLMRRTAEKIRTDLCQGGVKRYLADTYYGGGQWVLLAAWLGWYLCEVGETEKARELRSWIETQVDEHGWLAEQVPVGLNDASMYDPWVQRWGPIASPLLWSHAEYLILCKVMTDLKIG
jgi:GH15 family glucan-1,4-alpha-glucosidase